MRIVLCAFGRAGIESLYFLLGNYNILKNDIYVFTHARDDNKDFVSHLNNLDIKYETRIVNSFVEELVSFNGDLLISAHYRNIIKNNVLDLFRGRAINVHPSLLPKYRGTFSSVWAIINDEKYTGITFHFMNEKVDDGNIILQKKVIISSDDTAFSLHNKLISISVFFLGDAIDKVMDGFKGHPQEGEVSYFPRILPFNGQIELNRSNKDEVRSFVRAMHYPPHAPACVLYKGVTYKVRNIEELDVLLSDDHE